MIARIKDSRTVLYPAPSLSLTPDWDIVNEIEITCKQLLQIQQAPTIQQQIRPDTSSAYQRTEQYPRLEKYFQWPTGIAMVKTTAGMGWILMQTNESNASPFLALLRRSKGTCNFDVTINGARLHPIRFVSHSCAERERHYHSFIGEASCGR